MRSSTFNATDLSQHHHAPTGHVAAAGHLRVKRVSVWRATPCHPAIYFLLWAAAYDYAIWDGRPLLPATSSDATATGDFAIATTGTCNFLMSDIKKTFVFYKCHRCPGNWLKIKNPIGPFS